MSNHFKIPKCLPFKFVPMTKTPGIHFDDAWFCEQIRRWEVRGIRYKQKWVKTDTTTLQVESSIQPDDLKIYSVGGQVVKTIPWTAVFTAVNFNVYELEFDIHDLADGVYFLYQKVALLSVLWEAISEPISSKAIWPDTKLITYKHSFNDYDVAWTTGIKMKFRCECDLPPAEFIPKRDRTSHVNQLNDVATLYGMPFRLFKFFIGMELGVAPWVIDLINRIFVCDYIDIANKLYQSAPDSEVEKTSAKGYPLVWGTIDLWEAKNLLSLEFSDTQPLSPGIVAAYNIETAFFGPGTLVPITEVEENS
jgi:hypothetical protein